MIQPLPTFTWVIPQALASSALPGSGVSVSADLSFARSQGVTHLLSLTIKPLNEDDLAAAGLQMMHLPIIDGRAATIEHAQDAVNFIDAVRSDGGSVLVHCAAGLGRTGTILACYLISRGYTAKDAMKEVRRITPGSIETREQEELLIAYERHLLVQPSPNMCGIRVLDED